VLTRPSSPAGAQSLPTCSLNPASTTLATGGSGTIALTVNTTAASTALLIRPRRANPWELGGGGAALAGLLMLGIPLRRRRWILTMILLCVIAASAAIGCGGGGGGASQPPSTPATTPGSYTFTVTGTDTANAKIATSANVSLTVE